MGLRQKHDLVSKLCRKLELQAIRGANRKLVGKCHFLPPIVNNRSGYKWKKDWLSSHCGPLLPILSSIIPALSCHRIFPLIYSLPGSFPSSPPGHSRPSAIKYSDHSPHFPDGFSKTSTAGRPGCSWGGTFWWIHSQSSGRIFPESRPQSGRSVCPSPPGHNNSKTTVFIQIAT